MSVSNTFHAWCVIYVVLRFLHKSCTLEPKNIARYCNKVSMKSLSFYVFCSPSMEQGFQAFSKETSVKEEFFVKFVFALQRCALVSAFVSIRGYVLPNILLSTIADNSCYIDSLAHILNKHLVP